jgi:lipopolysaccharide transport system ATP-binding protein
MSRDVVIRAENISKLYRLGQVGTGTLSHDLKRWWALARGKEDPYMKVGVENDRTKKAASDYAWALKDINFDIKQGDTLGIIGKNGAGKSTLLKLLSRVTSPTTGQIKVKGRIASLLEVGTGFHPELTGKENIYMNGAILGMTRKEISSKFDEIVDFAGVELYINTPVKRYSSGMYVRLAFGVAAHLEPEILIVDEVLAVGDAEFQKKCLGKMGDVASHGRTIIFVSHNMQAVQSLCKSALYLKSGMVVDQGQTDKVIDNYLSREITSCMQRRWEMPDEAPGNHMVRLISANIVPQLEKPEDPITVATSLSVQFEFLMQEDALINLSLFLYSSTGVCIFNLGTRPKQLKKGQVCFSQLEIPARLLNDNIYTISLYFVKDTSSVIYTIDDVLTFEVVDEARQGTWYGDWPGAIRPALNFTLEPA